MSQPTQVLPSWLTLSTTLVTLPDGSLSTSSAILRLPLTYYGPSSADVLRSPHDLVAFTTANAISCGKTRSRRVCLSKYKHIVSSGPKALMCNELESLPLFTT
ncbi:hypothetical protein GY45DRAFT_289101 [Cubamyces sp. BRFM 1775]|nr:hypothetical protein GY45DRAFT_289101 [Cubamyces sp. BRFM 1775]